MQTEHLPHFMEECLSAIYLVLLRYVMIYPCD